MIIQVSHLSKHFDYYQKELGLRSSIKNLFSREKLTKVAVDDICFAIEAGEMVGFLGPNGAGKTTTLKMLAGILYPTSGEASVLGFTPWERKKAFKMQFAIVMGQKNQLWWDLPANESLYLNKCIYEIDDATYEHTLAELTELLDVQNLLNVQVRRLSLGERMKMELIGALIHKPRLIFLDEPTIGLDIISQKKFRQFFKYYNEQHHTTIILTSHYMEDIKDLCKRAIVINQGHIVFDGSLQQVNEVFSQSKIIKLQLSSPVDQGDLTPYGEVREFSDFTATIQVPRLKVKDYSKRILDQLPVSDFNIEDVPIEDGIARLYQQQDQPQAQHQEVAHVFA